MASILSIRRKPGPLQAWEAVVTVDQAEEAAVTVDQAEEAAVKVDQAEEAAVKVDQADISKIGPFFHSFRLNFKI